MLNSVFGRIKKFFSIETDLENEMITDQTITNWINRYLQQKNMSIKKIEELIDGSNWKILFEILWRNHIDYEIDTTQSKNKIRKENYNQMIQYLQTKQVITSNFISDMILKKDLLSICWMIISKFSVDWIKYYGITGKDGLLKWINTYTDVKFQNFVDSWENGKTICKILHHYYPENIDIISLEKNNDPIQIKNFTYSCLKNNNVPILVNFNDKNNLDEKSIIIQYAIMFDFLSKESVLNSSTAINNAKNSTINGNNDTQNTGNKFYTCNCSHTNYEPPNFNAGLINENDLNNFIQNENHVIKKINNYFKIIMAPRYPVQIAYIIEQNDDLIVQYKYNEFEEVLKRASHRPIIFISCLGRYQQGKSTLISGLTGNIGYAIGKGNKETTKGVYVDGPYELDYLYTRYKIEMRKNIYFGGNELLSPLIFFFDIEGYDGIMHGKDTQKNNEAFIEMCTPFLCLSSIFLFLSEPNANINEIKSFFERMKISNLTTYSNNNDSNGALHLHIIFNKYNSILNDESHPNILKSIRNFRADFKNEWIGGESLTKYGIEYNFIPIIEGIKPFYDQKPFYTAFKYFALQIIRSIEDATEGSFVRCVPQSINLFKYVIEHFNEPNFEQDIKQLIKDEHENSFHTLSNRAYEKSCKIIFPFIENEFQTYENDFTLEVNIDEIHNRYITKGENEIQKELNAVKDHPDVSLFIEKFLNNINTTINEKYDHYKKVRDDLINKFSQKIDQYAQQKAVLTLNLIYKELVQNKYYSFNDEQISNLINNRINEYSKDLTKYKNENNLFLLSQQKINNIVIEKTSHFKQTIEKYIKQQRENINKHQEEIEIKSHVLALQTQIIKNKYCLRVEQLLNDLKSQLSSREYYLSNYSRLLNINDEYQEIVLNFIISKKREIMGIIRQTLIQNDAKNETIIKRLEHKNEFSFDPNIIHLVINENQINLTQQIITIFNRARNDLTEISIAIKKTKINIAQVKIESQRTITYPDGKCVIGQWELVRIEKKQFIEIIDEIGECIVHVFKYLIRSLLQIQSIKI